MERGSNFKNSAVILVILLAAWLVMNNSVGIGVVLTGLAISIILSLLLCRSCEVFREMKLSLPAFYYTVVYLFVFISELIKANIDIAWRVLSPSLPIKPGIIRARTRLSSRMGRLILANSITLTPGTFTIGIKDDYLYIHCVHLEQEDMEKEAGRVIGKFEKYLLKIYG
jgi:multicomponent Na+:H+ antiporter subunit E